MGLGDFWLQFNNGRKERLSDIKGDIRRETVDKKYQKIFDFFDTNKNGAIEGKEAEVFMEVISKFAGDKTLSQKEASSIFSKLGIENAKEVDFTDFVYELSEANKKIKTSDESFLPDGSRKVITNYTNGARLTVVYYSDGELKYTIKELPSRSTNTSSKARRASKGAEVGFTQQNYPSVIDSQTPMRKVEFSERAKSELRQNFGAHFKETADNIISMIAPFMGDMTVWDRAGIDMRQAFSDGDLTELFTADGVKKLEELLKQAKDNSKLGQDLTEMALNHVGTFEFHLEQDFNIRNFDFEKMENFHQTATKYLNAKSLKQRITLLENGIKEVKRLYQNALAKRNGVPNSEKLNADYDKKFMEVLTEYFNGDDGVASAFFNTMKEGIQTGTKDENEENNVLLTILDRIQKATNQTLSESLQGEKFENLESRYKAEFKDIYGQEDNTTDVENIIQTGQEIGGTIKIGAMTTIQILLSALTMGTGNAALIAIMNNPLVSYLNAVGTDYALSVLGALSSQNGLTSEKHGQIIDGTKETAKFIGVGSLSAPLCRYIGQTMARYTGKLFENGVKTTVGNITTTTVSGESFLKNLCTKSANFVGSTGTELFVFIDYEVAMNDEDFNEAMDSQSSMLSQLKVVNKFLQTALGKFVQSQSLRGQQKLAEQQYQKFLQETGLDKAKITQYETPTGTRFTGEINGIKFTGNTEEEIHGKLLVIASQGVNKGVNKGIKYETYDDVKPESSAQQTSLGFKPKVLEMINPDGESVLDAYRGKEYLYYDDFDYFVEFSDEAGAKTLTKAKLPRKEEIIQVSNDYKPFGTVACTSELNKTLVTSGMVQCAAVAVVDKANNRQTLIHLFPGYSTEDNRQIIEHIISQSNPKDLEISIVSGYDKQAPKTVQFALDTFSELVPDTPINLCKFDQNSAVVVLKDGKIGCCLPEDLYARRSNIVTNPEKNITYCSRKVDNVEKSAKSTSKEITEGVNKGVKTEVKERQEIVSDVVIDNEVELAEITDVWEGIITPLPEGGKIQKSFGEDYNTGEDVYLDSSGHVIQRIVYEDRKNNLVSAVEQFDFSSDGKAVESRVYEEGELEYKVKFEYDQNGNKTKISTLGASGILLGCIKNEYDKENNLIKRQVYANGKLNREMAIEPDGTKKEYDVHDDMMKITNSDGKTIYVYNYSEQIGKKTLSEIKTLVKECRQKIEQIKTKDDVFEFFSDRFGVIEGQRSMFESLTNEQVKDLKEIMLLANDNLSSEQFEKFVFTYAFVNREYLQAVKTVLTESPTKENLIDVIVEDKYDCLMHLHQGVTEKLSELLSYRKTCKNPVLQNIDNILYISENIHDQFLTEVLDYKDNNGNYIIDSGNIDVIKEERFVNILRCCPNARSKDMVNMLMRLPKEAVFFEGCRGLVSIAENVFAKPDITAKEAELEILKSRADEIAETYKPDKSKYPKTKDGIEDYERDLRFYKYLISTAKSNNLETLRTFVENAEKNSNFDDEYLLATSEGSDPKKAKEATVKLQNKIRRNIYDNNLENVRSDIDITFRSVLDEHIREIVEQKLKEADSHDLNKTRKLRQYKEIQNIIDIYNNTNRSYTTLTNEHRSIPFYREFLDFCKKNDSEKELLRELTQNYSKFEKIARRFVAYISKKYPKIADNLNISKYKEHYKEFCADFQEELRIQNLREYCKYNNDELSDYMYTDIYLKSSIIPEEIKQQCEEVHKKYGVKIFIPSEALSDTRILDFVKQELQIWLDVSGGKAKLPPTIDFLTAKDDYLEGYGGFSESHNSGAVSIRGFNISSTMWALRHEIAHTNDSRLMEEFPCGIKSERLGTTADGKTTTVVDLENCKYVDEFRAGGISEGHISYAYKNPKEFIAVASEGDMSKYSAEFKEFLVELGLPRWVLDMPAQKTEGFEERKDRTSASAEERPVAYTESRTRSVKGTETSTAHEGTGVSFTDESLSARSRGNNPIELSPYLKASNKVFELKPGDFANNPQKVAEARRSVEELAKTNPQKAKELQIIIDMFEDPTPAEKVTDEQIDAVCRFLDDHYRNKEGYLNEQTDILELGTIGRLGHRIKGNASTRDKVKNYIDNSIEKNKGKNLLDAYNDVRDKYACRTVFEIGDFTNHPSVSPLIKEAKALQAEGKIKEAQAKMHEAELKAAQLQSQPAVEKIKQAIIKAKAENADLSIMRISNYVSKNGIPIFSELQLAEIKRTGAEQGINVEFIRLASEMDPRLTPEERKEQEKKLTTKSQPSGYTALQINFVTKSGEVIEWQFRGERVNTFAEAEHLPYDLRTGKNPWKDIPELEALYKPIADLLEEDKMPEEAYNQLNKYFADYYTHLRRLELGFESEEPKLEDYEKYKDENGAECTYKFDKRLEAKNLIALHDYAEGIKDGVITSERAVEEFNKEVEKQAEIVTKTSSLKGAVRVKANTQKTDKNGEYESKLSDTAELLKQLGTSELNIQKFKANCSQEVLDYIEERVNDPNFDLMKEGGYFCYLNQWNLELAKTLRADEEFPQESIGLIIHAAYNRFYSKSIMDAYEKDVNIVAAAKKMVQRLNAQEAAMSSPEYIARQEAYKNGVQNIKNNTKLEEKIIHDLGQWGDIADSSIQELIIYCETNGIKKYHGLLEKCNSRKGRQADTESRRARVDYAIKGFKNGLSLDDVNELMREYGESTPEKREIRLNQEIVRVKAENEERIQKENDIQANKTRILAKCTDLKTKAAAEKALSNEKLPEDIILFADQIFDKEMTADMWQYFDRCLNEIVPEKYNRAGFLYKFNQGLKEPNIYENEINSSWREEMVNAPKREMTTEYLSSLTYERNGQTRPIFNESSIKKLQEFAKENPDVANYILDICINKNPRVGAPFLLQGTIEGFKANPDMAFSILNMKSYDGTPRFDDLDADWLLSGIATKSEIIQEAFRLEKLIGVSLDKFVNKIYNSHDIKELRRYFANDFCKKIENERFKFSDMYHKAYDIDGGIRDSFIENPDLTVEFINKNTKAQQKLYDGKTIKLEIIVKNDPELYNRIKTVFDTRDEKESYRANQILENLNADNMGVAHKLYLGGDTELPINTITSIMQAIKPENKKFASQLLEIESLDKKHIRNILDAAVISDPNDAGGNNGHPDPKKMARYTKLLTNPKLSAWVNDMLEKGWDIETISKLAPSKRSFHSEVQTGESKDEVIGYFNDLGLNDKQAEAVKKAISRNGEVVPELQEQALRLINSNVDKSKIGDILNFATINGKIRPEIVEDAISLQSLGLNPLLEKQLPVLKNLTAEEVETNYNKKIKPQILAIMQKTVTPDMRAKLAERGFDIDEISAKLTSQSVRTEGNGTERAKQTLQGRARNTITGFEKFIVDKYNPSDAVWRSSEETAKWAEKKYNEKYNDYKKGLFRSLRTGDHVDVNEVNNQREKYLEAWFKFIDTDEEIKRNPFIKVILADYATHKLAPENSAVPPELNVERVKNALTKALETGVLSFEKAYTLEMNKAAKESSGVEVTDMEIDGRKMKWYTVPQTDSSREDFEEMAGNVQALSDGTNWCIRTWNAKPYIQKGNIHFLVDEDGKTQVCIRENDTGHIAEIQKRQQNGTVPVAYIDYIQKFIKEKDLKGCESNIKTAVENKPIFDAIKAELQQYAQDKDYKAILEKMGIKVTELPDGTWELSHYGSYVKSYALSDLGIKENDLLSNVSVIKGPVNFKDSNVTSLPKLREVGGELNFAYAEISNLKSLERINGKDVLWGGK